MIDRVNILGAQISAITLDRAVSQIRAMVTDNRCHYICVSNVHTVMTCFDNPDYRRITNEATLAVPDGMPLVWIMKGLGYTQCSRVYGPDLMLAVCKNSIQNGYSHFFYGGAKGVPEFLAAQLRREFPGLRVAGCYSPPFHSLSPEEDEEVVKMINNSGAQLLWVGLGAPKQEIWIAEHRDRIKTPVMVGVGAAFDFLSGRVKQAPAWMQEYALEWLFRLWTDPKRLWQRYLYHNPRFIYHISKQLFRHRMRANKSKQSHAEK